MTYTPRTRDRYRLAVAAVSGITAVAALTCTGWLAGAAAHDDAVDEAARTDQAAVAKAKYRAELLAWKQARQSQADNAARVARTRILRPRPQRTHVTMRYVRATESAAVGTGGLVTRSTGSTAPPPAPVPAPATQPQQQPPAPAPPPPPAPSSGS